MERIEELAKVVDVVVSGHAIRYDGPEAEGRPWGIYETVDGKLDVCVGSSNSFEKAFIAVLTAARKRGA